MALKNVPFSSPMLRFYLDGIQFALGDLTADAKVSGPLAAEVVERDNAVVQAARKAAAEEAKKAAEEKAKKGEKK